jgi:hypothetical protein
VARARSWGALVPAPIPVASVKSLKVPTVFNSKQPKQAGRNERRGTKMLELAPYGLTGLVAILLIAFCFACQDDSASFSDNHSFSSMADAELHNPKGIERRTRTADGDIGPRSQKHEGALNG